jgi:hypothetical protein
MQIDPTSRPDIVDITHELINAVHSKDDQFQVSLHMCSLKLKRAKASIGCGKANASLISPSQEIPCLEDMLGIEPLETHFPFELDLKMSHSIELTNDTDDYIAFMTKAGSCRFRIEPDKGIVPPGSKCSVTITMQAQVNALPNNHHKEEITVLSTRVDGGLAAMDITRDVFIEKEGNVVDEVNVMVVFDNPPPADEES